MSGRHSAVYARFSNYDAMPREHGTPNSFQWRQPVAHCVFRQARDGENHQLIHDSVASAFNRFRADIQRAGDFFQRRAFGEILQNTAFRISIGGMFMPDDACGKSPLVRNCRSISSAHSG